MRSDIPGKIEQERKAQDEKWGGPEHDDTHSVWDWICYIHGHARAAGSMLRGVPPADEVAASLQHFRYQMVRVAALAVAAIESVDRAIVRMGK